MTTHWSFSIFAYIHIFYKQYIKYDDSLVVQHLAQPKVRQLHVWKNERMCMSVN